MSTMYLPNPTGAESSLSISERNESDFLNKLHPLHWHYRSISIMPRRHHISHTLRIPDWEHPVKTSKMWLMVCGRSRQNFPHKHLQVCDDSWFATTSYREHIPWITELLDSLSISSSLIVLLSIDRCFPRHQVHLNSGSVSAQRALNVIALFVSSAQATT